MNKQELVKKIAEAGGISQAAAERTLKGMLDSITECLSSGDSLTLVGFGIFSVRERAERQGRNPQTGKPLTISARKVVGFKTGKKLAEAVRGG
jgi:DNA-binding protein HU-beta